MTPKPARHRRPRPTSTLVGAGWTIGDDVAAHDGAGGSPGSHGEVEHGENLIRAEGTTRALFAGDAGRFRAHTEAWPADLRDYAYRMAEATFKES